MKFNASSLNAHWQDKKLSELGSFARGKSKHRPRNDPQLFKNGIYPLVQTGEIKGSNLFVEKHSATYNNFGLTQSKLWPKGTLCITIAANIAETALLEYPMCFPDSIVGFLADKQESSELFMHYVFTYIRQAIQNSTIGSIQDNINIDYLTELEFKIPIKNYQDKIVEVLSSLDKKIALNNKINTELEAMAKLIYDYWFVQFDFPDSNGKPYKSSGGKMVYNEVLKREIPEGWEARKLTEEVDVQYGYPFSTKMFNEEGMGNPIVRIRNILENSITMYSTESVDDKYLIKKGDLLIGMDGNFHLNFWDKNNCYLNQRCVRIRKNKDSQVSHLQVKFDIEPYIKSREKNVSRTTVGHLSAKDIETLNVLVPFSEVVLSQREFFDNILRKIIINKNENQALSELRDWLLPMLMNGQVTVKDA